MGWWGDHVVPRLVDASLSQSPVMDLRRRAFAGLGGRVLELGFGSGLNLAVYPEAVTSVDAVDPSDVAWHRSQEVRRTARMAVARVGLDGGDLAAEDASYDAVACAFTLCTVPDPARALREVRRVLAPGGSLYLLEHGLAPDSRVATWQRRLDGLQGALFGGCHLTRDPVAAAADAGLMVEEVEDAYLAPGPGRVWTYLSWGRAARGPG